MRISIIQTDIVWENKQENLCRIREKLETLRGVTEIVVLPETFSTGFSMDTARLAEPMTGETITTLHQWAKEFGFAIAGSFIAAEEASPGRPASYHNRAFFVTPDADDYFYDKRHLFRMGGEAAHFDAGDKRPVISYRGWNILLLVCYDLRFPVWSRNAGNEYDLLIYVANWPASRRKAWDVLLQARAIENMSYVCGVNRIGADNHGLPHNGGSALFSPKGELLASIPDNEEGIATVALDLSDLKEFRTKFPAWKDADSFKIISL
ncbi:putative amidohydrolase [Bacteroides zoogleoformans]|uniref:Amidohydrolase n=1 Tax=Bacteroides zoogleoformans TaxID=28119 RepID=A0ABM6T9E6_9BACE|nr:amidohydrolase [Bacteroides zoogleoformans]AVM53396.1 amidohydrolase [Bacteroides zoogleoformans]TWJ17272.1 putative amidohydrolase [Bacteroides zoogleoformans]